MVGWKMDGPARDRVLQLIQEKDRMESEIRDQTAILETNHIGMHEPLVDEQGYPRTDIDVYKVRLARHQIICLQNDHKNIMKMIEKGLAEVHADLLGSHGETPDNAPSTSNGRLANGHVADGHVANGHIANGHVANGHVANGHVANGHVANGHVANGYGSSGHMENNARSRSVDSVVSREPFAVVTSVMDGSPADLAGLCANDKILIFGSINHSNFENMNQIYNIVSHSVGQPINVQVKRETSVVNLTLVPRPSERPGLLGCHIQRTPAAASV